MPILTDQERLGTTIGDGRYRLDSVLGRGGMGTVFEGVHEWTGRRVAVKLLRHDVASDVDASQRFLQEARSATAIEHPNVVEVLDMGRHDEWTVYMVFELLRGQSLADRLDAVGRLEPMEAAMILLPVADAVAAAHRLGIVHRDLKPENIFLEDDGMGYIRPKLLDFGIARAADREGTPTRTGVIAGTPQYLSPEHAQGYRAGPASDVWSLGVVMFECITGNRPFEGDSMHSVLVAITTNSIPSLHDCAGVPGPIADVVQRAMTRDPAARIPDGEGFRDALAAASQVDFLPSRSRSVPPKILRDSGEIALSSSHRVENRQSSPGLPKVAAWTPTAGPAGRCEASAVPTVDDVLGAANRSVSVSAEEDVVLPRRRGPAAFALVAALLVVVVVFGYGAIQLAGAREADAASAMDGAADARPSAAVRAGTRVAPEDEIAAAVVDPGSAAELTSVTAMTRIPASALPPDESEVVAPASAVAPAAHSDSETPRPVVRARRFQPTSRPGIQRGANGSLILD